MAKGEREGSSLLLWPTLFGAGAMSYSRSSYAVADHPADGKTLEVDGLFQGFHDLMKEDRYVSRDHPLELFF
jgi:hypothetical protein